MSERTRMPEVSSGSSLSCVIIVGFGSIGRRHCSILRELFPSIKIVALRHKGYACEHNLSLEFDHCVYSIEEALNYKPEMAIIANPASFHLSVAMPLAEAGVHLMVEKPLSIDREGIQELINCCKENGSVLMTGYNLRFLPSLRFFQESLGMESIGRLLSVRVEAGQNLTTWRPGVDYRRTVSAQKNLGGGVLLELSHELDYLLWLFGKVDWVSANLSRQSNLDIDVEDTAHLLVGFEKDERGYQLITSIDLDFVRYDSVRRCTVIGEQGTLEWNGIEGTVKSITEKSGDWKELFSDIPDRNFTYQAELLNFISCIESGEKPMITGEDGLAVLRVAEAALKSSNEDGRKMRL